MVKTQKMHRAKRGLGQIAMQIAQMNPKIDVGGMNHIQLKEALDGIKYTDTKILNTDKGVIVEVIR